MNEIDTRILDDLRRRLVRIAEHVDAVERQFQADLADIPGDARESARNLIHYLAFRQQDLRLLQRWLTAMGVSSLGHTEAHVKAGLAAVMSVIDRVKNGGAPPTVIAQRRELRRMQQMLSRRTRDLFGRARRGRPVRIMVTMPTEAATDQALVKEMLEAGMDLMRINCAHDGPEAWEAMVQNLRRASMELNRPCRVLMDLAGPKLRTGPVEEGPKVRRIRPERDALGREIAPARVSLFRGPVSGDLPASGERWKELARRDALEFIDARGRQRRWEVVEAGDNTIVCEGLRTAYVIPGTELVCEERDARLVVGDLPAQPGAIRLQRGDHLMLDGNMAAPGREAAKDSSGAVVSHARIPFTCPEILPSIEPGQPVWFDDGKIGGVVEESSPAGLRVRITQTRPGGAVLRADKGVNFPGLETKLPTLNEKDLRDLRHAIQWADLVGLSFVRTAADVQKLRSTLRELHGERLGIVLKIETQQGVSNLPYLLLNALKHDRAAVMIARGDMAIECDYRRMAELQEEILWFCEAAHVPVIWATQVLDTLAKTGVPSRAEISDASMGERAECVMLNKGPHITTAIRVLDDILRRMSGHQEKKTSRLRSLRLAGAGDRATRRALRVW